MSKKIFLAIVMCICLNGYSQNRPVVNTEKQIQSAKSEFVNANFSWPPKNVYLRVFKFERQLEVWVNYADSAEFQLLKTFKICMISGKLGPKRKEGDLQVPEGFYVIDEYRPNSTYHMSLGINYPNESDRALSRNKNLGGNIYIHGACVSIGCIAFDNPTIEKIYAITAAAHSGGQRDIPVHIFPVNYELPPSHAYLNYILEKQPELRDFEENIKEGFYKFQLSKKLPIINVKPNGAYEFN